MRPSNLKIDVEIDYTNYQGQRATRRIKPMNMKFGANQWYPEPQYLMLAYDYEKEALREFAMKSINSWTVVG
jgi:predicted DNA-binding transcriptional regulator YafY